MLRIDLTGKRFNMLLVVRFLRMKGSHAVYKCICDCGKDTEAYGANLKTNHTASCGCLSIKHKAAFAVSGVTHGNSNHPLFKSWIGMRTRCYYKNHNRFEHYGGKGIKVCNEWKDDFPAFYNWGIENGWEKGLSIDRINNQMDYCPKNCKFSTVAEQNRNRTSNINITYNGKTMIATDWAKLTGVGGQTITKRFRKGWDIKDVIYGKGK